MVRCSPSVGNEFTGVRPAVVVQSAQTIRKVGGVVTVAIMTSHKGKKWKHDILVQRSKCNGLWNDSLVKVEYLYSFDKSRFLRKIGNLEDEWMGKIKEYLKAHFDVS